MKRAVALLLLALSLGCASKYTRGIDYDRRGLSRVEGVDVLWWKKQRVCQVTVIFWDGDIPKSFTLDNVDPRICGEKP